MGKSKQQTQFVNKDWMSIAGLKRFSHEAMATVFELFILHPDGIYAEQAAWAAFDELDRLEAELSKFIENSDIARINNLAANQPLQVGLATTECLKLAIKLYEQTNGALDVTVGTLMECWLNKDKTLKKPSEEQLTLARERIGTNLITLDESNHTVQLKTEGLQVDLGGIGKGYAVDKMAELLAEWSIDTALISSGSSTVLAVGRPEGKKGWPLTISHPPRRFASQTRSSGGKKILARIQLSEGALSGSGLQKGEHIINPRSGKPVEGKSAAWAWADNAATSDALSTAFMIMNTDEIEEYCREQAETQVMVILQDKKTGSEKIFQYGRWSEF